MSIVNFKYLYLNGKEIPNPCFIVVDTEKTKYLGEKSVLRLSDNTYIDVPTISVEGQTYGSPFQTYDPNGKCCDGSIDFTKLQPVPPGTDPSDLRVPVYDEDGNVYYVPADEVISQPYSATAYVAKKYTGTPAVNITGYTLANISSANDSYNAQLAAANIGDMNNPFPDPYSARNALMDAIAAGTIQSGQIVVNADTIYTIGSDVAANNGDLAGVSTNPTVADICFTSANSADVSSIMKNKIDIHFNNRSGFTYICWKYQILFSNHVDATGGEFKSTVSGEGEVRCIYGVKTGVWADFAVFDNPNCEIYLTFREVYIQQYGGFQAKHFRKYYVRIINFYGAPGMCMALGTRGLPSASLDGDGSPCYATILIDNLFYSYSYPYPTDTNTTGPFLVINTFATQRSKHFYFEVKNLEMYERWGQFMVCNGSDTVNAEYNWNNMNLTARFGNVVCKKFGTDAANGGFMYCGGKVYQNSIVNLWIDNITTDCTLIGLSLYWTGASGTMSNNVQVNIHCNNALRKNVGTVPMIYLVHTGVVSTSQVTNRYVISGVYRSLVALPVVSIAAFGATPTILSGIFQSLANAPVVQVVTANNQKLALVDASLINDGTAPTVVATVAASNIYMKNVHGSADVNANVVQNGDTLKVSAVLKDYV